MKHLIIRTGINTYKYVVKRLESQVTSDAILNVWITNYESHAETIEHRPMFSTHYLLRVYYKDDKKFFNFIKGVMVYPWVQCIVYIDSAEIFESFTMELKGIPHVAFDSYTVSKDFLIKYVQQSMLDLSGGEIKLSKEKADLICTRIRFKEYELDRKLELLSHTDLSIATIKKHLIPYTGVSNKTFPYHFLMKQKQRELGTILIRNLYDIKYLYSGLLEYIDTWFELYDEYYEGHLNKNTIVEWVRVSGATYKIKQEYQAKRWLDLLEIYSYERMMYLRVLLQSKSNYSSYNKTMLLIRILRSGI